MGNDAPRFIAVIALFLLLSVCGGCSGSGEPAVQLGSVSGQSPAGSPVNDNPALPLPQGPSAPFGPPLPTDDPLAATSRSRATSKGLRIYSGDSLVEQLGGLNSFGPQGSEYTLRPATGAPYAWGLYRFDELNRSRPVGLRVEVAALSDGAGAELPLRYWVATSDYSRMSWRWSGPYSGTAAIELNSSERRERLTSAGHVAHVVVLADASPYLPVGGTAAVVIRELQLETLSPEDGGYLNTRPLLPLFSDVLVGGVSQKDASSFDAAQQLTFVWQHADDEFFPGCAAVSYDMLRRAVGSGQQPQLIGSAAPQEASFNDPLDAVLPPEPGEQYEYFLRAVNSVGSSALGGRATVAAPLLPPASVSASQGTFASRIILNWQASQGADSYLIYRNDELLPIAETTGTLYEDFGAVEREPQTYIVRSVNAHAMSEPSSAVSGFRQLQPPYDLKASYSSFLDRIVLDWQKPAEGTGFIVYRDGTEIARPGDVSEYTDFEAPFATDVSYTVVALNFNSQSDPSEAAIGRRSLPAPQGLSASQGSFAERIELSWTKEPLATGYRLYRSDLEQPLVILGDVASHTDLTVPHDTELEYTVSATVGAQESEPSEPATGYRRIPAPQVFSASDGDYGERVRLSWQKVPGALGYAVYRDNQDSPLILLGDTDSYEDFSAEGNVVHSYWLRASIGLDFGGFSAEETGYSSPDGGGFLAVLQEPVSATPAYSIEWTGSYPASPAWELTFSFEILPEGGSGVVLSADLNADLPAGPGSFDSDAVLPGSYGPGQHTVQLSFTSEDVSGGWSNGDLNTIALRAVGNNGASYNHYSLPIWLGDVVLYEDLENPPEIVFSEDLEQLSENADSWFAHGTNGSFASEPPQDALTRPRVVPVDSRPWTSAVPNMGSNCVAVDNDLTDWLAYHHAGGFWYLMMPQMTTVDDEDCRVSYRLASITENNFDYAAPTSVIWNSPSQDNVGIIFAYGQSGLKPESVISSTNLSTAWGNIGWEWRSEAGQVRFGMMLYADSVAAPRPGGAVFDNFLVSHATTVPPYL